MIECLTCLSLAVLKTTSYLLQPPPLAGLTGKQFDNPCPDSTLLTASIM